MTYKQAIEWLYSLNIYKINYSLSEIRKFAKPESLRVPSIHIAGTAGKGTAAMYAAHFLQSVGYRVGLYTSPHILDFRERIRINGKKISPNELVQYVRRYKDRWRGLSFFEFTTLIALDYFFKKKVDYSVIEVGMGGRLDATNIIHPKVSIITRVDYDHCDFLGYRLADIAKEKMGIIKPGVPVITTRQRPSVAELLKGAFVVEGPREAAFEAVKCLGIQAKMTELRLPARCETVKPDIVFDVAHNPVKMSYFLERLREKYPDQKFHFIVGLMRDKDHKKILQMLGRFIYVNLNTPRARHVKGALTMAQALASRPKDCVTCVTGSFYAVEEAARILKVRY